MTINLDSTYSEITRENSGSGVNDAGDVVIGASTEGQSTIISTSNDTTVITVTDAGGFQIGSGEEITEIVAIINPNDPDIGDQVPTALAVSDFVAAAVSSSIEFLEFDTKTEFDAYLLATPFNPTIAFVYDPTPFDFTDSKGNAKTGLSWMFVVAVFVPGDPGTVSTTMVGDSDSSTLTGPEIVTLVGGVSNTNFVTDSQLSAIQNIPADTNTELASKQNTEVGKGLSENNLTNARASKVDNLPNNTNNELSSLQSQINSKVSTSSVTTNISASSGNIPDAPTVKTYVDANSFDGGTISNPVTIEGNTKAELILKADSNALGEGGIAWQNSGSYYTTSIHRDPSSSDSAPDIVVTIGSDGSIGALSESFRFKNSGGVKATGNTEVAGNLSITGTITRNGNTVIDSSDSKYSNIPANTNSELASKVGTSDAKYQNIPEDTNAELATKVSTSSENTFTKNQVISKNLDSRQALTLKRLSNSLDMGISWQNSGNNYISSLWYDESSNGLKISLGSDADITGLSDIIGITSSLVDIKPMGCDLHVNGDIFAFNGGNMAAQDITAVRKFVSSDYRLNSSPSDSNWALYKSAQGNTSGPENSKAADGKSFSGQAARIRVANSTDQGFIIENGIGLNLFEINGSTGIANFSNNIEIAPNSRVIRSKQSHSNDGIENIDFGSVTSNHFTGLRVKSVYSNNYNQESLEFYTHSGGVDSGKRMSISDDGHVNIGNSINIGSSETIPTNTLDVDGTADISEFLKVHGSLSLFDNSNREIKFEKDTNGIKLRALSNPDSGDPIFQVLSSGGGMRLRVEHDGAISTGNDEIKVGANNDGTGGHPVLTPNNIGDLVASKTYLGSFPSLSASIIAQWFYQMAHVQFLGVGGGTISLPQIVASNPSSTQVLAGTTITITNYNSGSDISLSRFNSGQTFMIDNVSDLRTSATLFSSSKIELQALDVRSYSAISTDWCWALRGI